MHCRCAVFLSKLWRISSALTSKLVFAKLCNVSLVLVWELAQEQEEWFCVCAHNGLRTVARLCILETLVADTEPLLYIHWWQLMRAGC